ncbi:MAG: 2,3,4,5-tetrahydropyridine-2,6-dicarboxylate N-succinyltransferase, partial [Burkholderiales bacterium]
MTAPQNFIDRAWDDRAALNAQNAPAALHEAVAETIARLDAGELRVAEKRDGEWVTHQWVKKAVLLSFRLADNTVTQAGELRYFDKVPTKFAQYTAADFAAGGFRVVPPATARRGAYIARNVVL